MARFDVLFRLEENRWNGTVAPQLVVRRVFDAEDRYEELAAWLRAQWKLDARDPAAEDVFDELLLESGVKRSLLESERFRALEERRAPAAASPSARCGSERRSSGGESRRRGLGIASRRGAPSLAGPQCHDHRVGRTAADSLPREDSVLWMHEQCRLVLVRPAGKPVGDSRSPCPPTSTP